MFDTTSRCFKAGVVGLILVWLVLLAVPVSAILRGCR